MKIVDLKEKEAREEAMPSVLENDMFRLEMKNGLKIESANISISPLGTKQNVSCGVGCADSIMKRTVENLLSLVTVFENLGAYDDSLIDMICDTAKNVAKRAVAEVKEEDGVTTATIGFGEEE